jgi:hypothetical protein
MTGAHDNGSLLPEPLDGGQCRFDAEVVGDGAILDRHVEVGAHEDAFAVDRRQVLQQGQAGHLWLAAPTMAVSSASRFE